MTIEFAGAAVAPVPGLTQAGSAGPLHVFATPGSDVSPLVAALAQALDGPSGGAVRAGQASEVATLAGQCAAGALIVCVGHPARHVANAIRGEDNLAARLDHWRIEARQLLSAVHMAPQRFLCLDLEEVDAWPAASATKLADWLHLERHPEIVPLGRMSEPAVDELGQFLAYEMVRADKATTLIYDELLACCAVLSEEPLPALAPTVVAAADRYRSLLTPSAARSQGQLPATAGGSGQLQDLSAAQQENELLLLQLHQVQEELERYYLASKAEEQMAGLGLSRLQVEHIRSEPGSDEPPHRHLRLRLEGVSASGGRWSTLDARLVEHVGRPGLALFADGTGRKPLSAWQVGGHENGREFMLLVPSDAHGARLLQPMGSADWRLVTGLAELAQHHVQTLPISGPWRTVAARLCRQLVDLPARLRYDALSTAPTGPQSATFEVRIGEATFGTRALGEIVLRWDAQGERLHWQAPNDVMRLPLASWPVEPDGALAPALSLPLGSKHPFAAKRAFWSALGPLDRDLVLGVLDALRGAARQIPSTAMHDLARCAAGWRWEARRLLLLLRGRALARRLLGRTR
jgi:hypothetical protein